MTPGERLEALEIALSELTERHNLLKKKVNRIAPGHFSPPDGVHLGEGARIHPSCQLFGNNGRDIYIGAKTLIRRGAEMIGPITIGSGCSFNRDAYVRANVHIGNNVNIGAYSRLVTDTHEIGGANRRAGQWSFPDIRIGNGVFIGVSCTVLGNVTIGDGAVVAAGSLVNKDVPAHTLVGGVPARIIKLLPENP